MQNNDTRGSLGSKFENFGAAPTEGLWGSIADSLEGKKKRRVAIWWWLGAAAVTIAGVGIVLTTMSNDEFTAETSISNPTNNENIIQTDPTMLAEDKNTVDFNERKDETLLESNGANNDPNTNSENLETDLNESAPTNGSLTEREVEVEKLDKEPLNTFENKGDDLVEMNPPKNNDHQDGDVDRKDPVDKEDIISPEVLVSADRLNQLPLRKIAFNYGATSLTPITAQKMPKNRWEMGITINRFNSIRGGAKYQNAEPTVDTSGSEYDILESINTNYNVRTTRPIGLKFYAGYQLSRRFRVVSGISAEYTSYRYTKSFEDAGINSVAPSAVVAIIPAKLTSVGIPIGLEFDFIKRRRFQMGTGVSLLNEFPFLQTYRPDYDVNYVGPQTKVRNFISGYNMGLSMNVNASVYLTDKMRIQASPIVRYYTRQKSTTTLNLQKRDLWFGGSVSMIWKLGK